ncbi:uncharacterized protein F5147DRAFT_723212 [Suillus discolor]|uniref:Uncharacterized protein n=1 Tax=Suillus discolor TaxID=1912936 RepID=A0A9P7EW72_9AGAM|nr:uncharacterized protein F5147DRAFT_723212 [Suillus discolor]KAG2091637.1 hypothetical protein F5147DRAFT_723212 [Suillus discolor]
MAIALIRLVWPVQGSPTFSEVFVPHSRMVGSSYIIRTLWHHCWLLDGLHRTAHDTPCALSHSLYFSDSTTHPSVSRNRHKLRLVNSAATRMSISRLSTCVNHGLLQQ